MLAAAAGIALTLALGNWQLGRGQEKTALKARLEQLAREPAINVSTRELAAPDVELRRVEARGTYEPKYRVLIDNRVSHGVAGYHVVMPLRLGDGSRLPEVKTPSGTVSVSGLAVAPGKRFFEISTKVAEGNVWQNLTLERYRQAVPIAIQPFVIQRDQQDAAGDGLIREWLPPDLGADTHYGYAIQWFALSAVILIFYLVTHVRRKREA